MPADDALVTALLLLVLTHAVCSSLQAAALQHALENVEAQESSLRQQNSDQAALVEQLEQGMRSKNMQLDDMQRHANNLAAGKEGRVTRPAGSLLAMGMLSANLPTPSRCCSLPTTTLLCFQVVVGRLQQRGGLGGFCVQQSFNMFLPFLTTSVVL